MDVGAWLFGQDFDVGLKGVVIEQRQPRVEVQIGNLKDEEKKKFSLINRLATRWHPVSNPFMPIIRGTTWLEKNQLSWLVSGHRGKYFPFLCVS